MDVSRIKDTTNQLTRFDETSIQILSVYLTLVIFCIAFPIFVFGNTEIPNFHFCAIGIPLILMGNMVLLLNLSPRLWAVLTGDDEKYQLSPVKRIEVKIKKQLARYSIDETVTSQPKRTETGTNITMTIPTPSPRSIDETTRTNTYGAELSPMEILKSQSSNLSTTEVSV